MSNCLCLFRAFSRQSLNRASHTEKHYVFVVTFCECIEKMRKWEHFASKTGQLCAEAKSKLPGVGKHLASFSAAAEGEVKTGGVPLGI